MCCAVRVCRPRRRSRSCLGAIFRSEYNGGDFEKFSQVEIAKIGQYAENVFFGKPSGLLDQTACAVGSAISIDFKDPAAPVVEKVAFDLAATGLCAVHPATPRAAMPI